MSLNINFKASSVHWIYNYPEGSYKYDEKIQYEASVKMYLNKI